MAKAPILTKAAKLQAALGPLLKEYLATELLPSQAIYDEHKDANSVAKLLERESYLAKHSDLETAASALDDAFALAATNGAAAVVSAFEEAVRAHTRDMVAVVPLEYYLSFKEVSGVRPAEMGVPEWRVAPPRRERKALNRTIQRYYGAAPTEASLVDHHNRIAGNHLLHSPLLMFPVHGSVHRGTGYVQVHFLRFKWLLDLYTASMPSQWRWKSANHIPNHHFFLIDVTTGYVHRATLWDGSAVPARFEMAQLREFGARFSAKYLPIFLAAPTKLRKRLDNALRFFSRSLHEREDLTRFLFAVIALESLFSKDRDAPIKATLADYSAILGYPKDARAAIHTRVREIYNVRSSIVHSGLSSVEPALADEVQSIAARVLVASLDLLTRVNADQKPEDAFFQHLLERKLS